MSHLLPAYDAESESLILFGREYPARQVIRMVLLVGGYILLRPYLLKLSAGHQQRDHAREVGEDEGVSPMAGGVGVDKGGLSEDEEDDDKPQWGKKARQRVEEAKRKELEEDMEDEELIAEGLLED